MFKMSSLYIAAGKKCFRLSTLVVGFSAFFAPLLPLTHTTVMAQSSDADAQAVQIENSNATMPSFEKEFLPSNQESVKTSSESLFFSTTENLRGRGNTPPASNPQWTIAATPGVKISVNLEGWYYVSANQLEMAGFEVNSNRTYWQLFTDAQEQPIKINSDGSIEFYGKELDTVQTGTRVYYLVYGQTAGKRITLSANKSSNSADATNFDITVERKPRLYYIANILNGEAENWFGTFFSNTQPIYENLSVYNPDLSGTSRLKVKLQGISTTQHTVNIKFNNIDLGNVVYSGYANAAFEFDVPMAAVTTGQNQVTLQAVGASGDYNVVDSVSLTYKRLYEAQNNRLHFSVPARKGLSVNDFTEGSINVFELQNGQVLSEVSVRVEQNGGNYGFALSASKNNRELIAVTNSQKEAPLSVERNYPSMWNSSTNNADLLIIAPQAFAQSAQTLANMRIQQGLNAKVVMTDDIYDEFGYGARSSQAIRDFLKNAVTYWSVKPRYVLLFGDSSFDQKGYYNTPSRNFIPPKMIDTAFYETASDSWYVDFNNDTVEDIAIGRLPAGNEAEAAQMVQKLARYDAQGARQAKKGVFVADSIFAEYSQELAAILPGTAQASVINRSQMSDAQMVQEIFTRQSDDPLLVVYTGHGSPTGWTNANLLRTNNVGNLTNNLLGFYMVVGCLNGYSQDPYNDSLAEALLKTPNGAMGVFASTGSIAVTGPTAMSPVLTDKIFNSQPENMLRIGDIIRLSKQNSQDADSKRTYQLFGDPTVYIK